MSLFLRWYFFFQLAALAASPSMNFAANKSQAILAAPLLPIPKVPGRTQSITIVNDAGDPVILRRPSHRTPVQDEELKLRAIEEIMYE